MTAEFAAHLASNVGPAAASHLSAGAGSAQALVAQTFVGPEVNWFALSPMLTLLAGALGMMLIGALTPTWPKGLYADGCCGHRRYCRSAGDGAVGRHHRQRPDDVGRRSDRVRHVGDVPHDHDLHRGPARLVADRRVPARHAERRARDLRSVPRRGHRWHRDGLGQRSDRVVPRPRNAVAGVVRARRVESTVT